MSPADGSALTPDVALRSREHRLTQAHTRLGRFGYSLQNRLESFIAGVSVHADAMIYDNADFPWTRELESRSTQIRAELDTVMRQREDIPAFQEILAEVGTIQNDDRWKTLWLAGVGMDCSENAARCPCTTQALCIVPGMKNAFFSILAPGKHIPAHRGAYNGVLRLHLALRVPQPQQRCRIRVGDRICHWREGEVLIFDDSFNHEVWNDTAGWRAVLFVDFARPLRQPWHALNHGFIALGALTPFMRAAARRQRDWLRRLRERGETANA